MGWDAPAGQAYSTVADLSKLMMLVFRDNQSVNTGDQVHLSFFVQSDHSSCSHSLGQGLGLGVR